MQSNTLRRSGSPSLIVLDPSNMDSALNMAVEFFVQEYLTIDEKENTVRPF